MIIQLKQLTPSNKLPLGILSEGKGAIEQGTVGTHASLLKVTHLGIDIIEFGVYTLYIQGH